MNLIELGDYADIKTGRLDANAAVQGGRYPFFTCARKPLEIDSYSFDENAILIAGNGDLNVKHYNGKFDAYQRTYVITADESVIDTRYLYYFMDGYVERLREMSIGGIIKYIKLGMLTGAKIPLPPLAEQKRIAAILDQADAIVKKRQAALDKLNTLGRSIFYDMFGDPKRDTKGFGFSDMGSVCQFYSGNTLPASEEFRGQSGGYFSLKVSDFNTVGNETKIVKAKLWSESGGSKAGTCPSNSIVFPKRGGAIGTNKKRILSRPSALDPNLMGVAPLDNSILSSYLFAWFKTFDLLEIASGSSVPQLNKKDLNDLKIITPPKKVQHDFLEKMMKLDESIGNQNKCTERAQTLFASLQQRAFRGEL